MEGSSSPEESTLKEQRNQSFKRIWHATSTRHASQTQVVQTTSCFALPPSRLFSHSRLDVPCRNRCFQSIGATWACHTLTARALSVNFGLLDLDRQIPSDLSGSRALFCSLVTLIDTLNGVPEEGFQDKFCYRSCERNPPALHQNIESWCDTKRLSLAL